MHTQRKLYMIGAWAFVLVGAGHLLTHWLAPKTTEQVAMLKVMRDFPIVMPGSAGNLYQYHTGFSLMMGCLLIAYGVQMLLTISAQTLQDTRLLAFHALVAALGLALSVMFFFLVPIAFMTVTLIAFAHCLLLARMTKSKAAKDEEVK